MANIWLSNNDKYNVLQVLCLYQFMRRIENKDDCIGNYLKKYNTTHANEIQI